MTGLSGTIGRAVAVAAVVVCASAMVRAQGTEEPVTGPRAKWLLLDSSLAPTGVREILSISEESVGFIDMTGATVARPLSLVSVIVPAGWWGRTIVRGVGVEPMGEPTMQSIRQVGGLLETTDGQRIPGTLEFAPKVKVEDPAKRPARPSAMPVVKPNAIKPGNGGQGGAGGQGGQPGDRTDDTTAPVPADGQAAGDGGQLDDTIRWLHPQLGALSFKLEQVRRWSVDQQPWTTVAAPQRDALLLANGDRLEGFVVGLVGNVSNSRVELSVKLEPPSGDPLLLPVQRLRAMLLSGAATAAQAEAARLVLADGTDVLVAKMQPLAGGKLKTHLLASVAPDSVVRIDAPLLVGFAPDAKTVVDLAATLVVPVPSAAQAGTESAVAALAVARSEPADLIAGSIDMPGWCTAVMTVPSDAKRVGMQLVVPEACRVYAECTVTVSLAGRVLATKVLTAKDPVADLSLPVSGGGELRVVLADGPARTGPVHDRVMVRRPIALR